MAVGLPSYKREGVSKGYSQLDTLDEKATTLSEPFDSN
jgi:hypothetical protein